MMTRDQLLSIIASLAKDGTAMEPRDALVFLADYLERQRPTMDQTDFEGLLYTAALIARLKRA